MTGVTVQVLFFAQARELSGVSHAQLTIPQQILVGDLLDTICESFNLTRIRDSVILSIDEEFQSDPRVQVTLRENSELAVIPPISGG